MRTKKAVNIVATRMMTKKTDLDSQCTQINWPQFVQTTSERISSVTEIESLEQFGHFLFNAFAPLFSTARYIGSTPACQQSITWRAASGC